MANSMRQQTLILTAVNAIVRALGLALRIVLSRMLGAELMGVAELAQSVHMLAIAPLTSGLPMAISRLAARAKPDMRHLPVYAGFSLVRRTSWIIIPMLFLLSVPISRMLGDARVLPSLWCVAPCVLILGYSSVYNGYCYSTEQSWIPAISELIEQVSRFLLCIITLRLLRYLTAPWLAAVPLAATMVAELIGLVFAAFAARLPSANSAQIRAWRKPVFRLSAPTTMTRVAQTALRSATAVLIPLRLQASGLSLAESTMRLGLFNGMVMPILMLPCIYTSALSMVLIPKLARAEDNPRALRRMLMKCAASCIPVAALSVLGVWFGAPVLANVVYRTPELTDLFRQSAPLSGLIAFSNVSGAIVAALGRQKQAMFGALPIAVLTLALTYFLTSNPALRLSGVILAQIVGQCASLLWNLRIACLRRLMSDDRSLEFRMFPCRRPDIR